MTAKEQYKTSILMGNDQTTLFCAMAYIAELEALQEPKSCESCSAYGKNYGMGYDHDYCVNLHIFASPLFGCIRHEKEQQ